MEACGSSLVFRGCQLPPGFRFQPTDQEIIVFYLKRKIAAAAAADAVTSIIADVDIYKFDPWELPDKAVFGEGEWFFFSPRDRKYPNGARPNRTAGSGYWKATGTDKPILAGGGRHCLGVKKALVFYQGRSPKGTKTDWVMHEYRLLDTDAAAAAAAQHRHSMRLDDWVLCRVRKKQLQLGVGADDYYTSTTAGTTSANHPLPAPVPVPDPDASAGFTDDIDWNSDDGHLMLHYLPDPAAIGSATGAASAVAAGHHGDNTPPAHAALVSVLESIKRNLSFQAIDELYLLQPSKRANCMLRGGGDHHQMMSPTSFSISEADEVL